MDKFQNGHRTERLAREVLYFEISYTKTLVYTNEHFFIFFFALVCIKFINFTDSCVDILIQFCI